MTRIFISVAAILGGISVAAGAFASHALKEKLSLLKKAAGAATSVPLSERALEIFETAARYQMYHALALLLVAVLLMRAESPQPTLIVTGWLFIVGVVIFSGSLYALSLTGIKLLGAITPLGGVALIAGWGALAIAAWKFK
ncbi:MAG: DUF423 domain-containing protein [Chroococcidiopsidaceae cyanobacterium CP_BM_RX_35]|nr:DUF423 domain-containing protein [Chroococcidiopsidaceae cyanobacterium CP_BM_RX_35]